MKLSRRSKMWTTKAKMKRMQPAGVTKLSRKMVSNGPETPLKCSDLS